MVALPLIPKLFYFKILIG